MKTYKTYSENQIDELRDNIRVISSPKRYKHTLAVEIEIIRLAEIYLPGATSLLRCAALLHDITKEFSREDQLQICKRFDIINDISDLTDGKTLHAKTAAALIPSQFPDFADKIIINAVRAHTTGLPGMDKAAKLLFLADYIEETRTFPDCKVLRKHFWDGIEMREPKEYDKFLDSTIIYGLDLGIMNLITEHKIISTDTINTRNELLASL
jgi:nicotinate-nucleotide adenylyltransferase